jgi:hypothetical protein
MALDVVGGLTGIGFAGNVLFGTVTAGVPGGSYTVGAGLSDFVSVSVDGNNRNAHLSGASACKGAASTANATATDLEGTTRVAPHDAGCYED